MFSFHSGHFQFLPKMPTHLLGLMSASHCPLMQYTWLWSSLWLVNVIMWPLIWSCDHYKITFSSSLQKWDRSKNTNNFHRFEGLYCCHMNFQIIQFFGNMAGKRIKTSNLNSLTWFLYFTKFSQFTTTRPTTWAYTRFAYCPWDVQNEYLQMMQHIHAVSILISSPHKNTYNQYQTA